jgi:homoserine kinase type II
MTRELPRTVYILQHARPKDDGDEDEKLIGVYSSSAAAEAAIERLRTQPGFRDWPSEFHIDPYDLDVDHWTEGFGIPWPPAVSKRDDG